MTRSRFQSSKLRTNIFQKRIRMVFLNFSSLFKGSHLSVHRSSSRRRNPARAEASMGAQSSQCPKCCHSVPEGEAEPCVRVRSGPLHTAPHWCAPLHYNPPHTALPHSTPHALHCCTPLHFASPQPLHTTALQSAPLHPTVRSHCCTARVHYTPLHTTRT